MAQVSNYLDDWLKNQRQLVAAWTDNVKKFQESVFYSWSGAEGHPWQAYMEQYLKACRASLSPGTSREVAEMALDVGERAAESENIYAMLYEMLTPILLALQQKALDVTCYETLLDPAKFKEVVDRTFGLNPEAIREFYDQTMRNVDSAVSSTEKFVEPWLEAFRKNSELMPLFVQGHPESFLKIFHNNYRAFDNTFGRAFHIPPVGKDREKIRLFQRGFDDLAVYMAKYMEYLHVMYHTGLRAMDELIRMVAHKITRDEVKSFDQVFELWIDINEKEYLELGRTKEYSTLQGELMTAGLNVRKNYFKLMELYLYDFPVALRSEMDDLYRTIYELKKKVRNLEARTKDMAGEEVAA